MNSSEFFNILDYICLTILFTSVLVGFLRGFTKDFFSTCAWLGSGLLATLITPYMIASVSSRIPNPMLARCVSLSLSYITILITLKVIINMLSSGVKATFLSGIDRLFGSLFGLFRGFGILICGPILSLLFGMQQDEFECTRESKLATIFYKLAEKLMPRVSNMTGVKIAPKTEKANTKSTIAIDFSRVPIKSKEKKIEKLPKPDVIGQNKENIINQIKDYIANAIAERYVNDAPIAEKYDQTSEIISQIPLKEKVSQEETPTEKSKGLTRRQRLGREIDKYRHLRPKYGIMHLLDAKNKRMKELRKKKIKDEIRKQLDR